MNSTEILLEIKYLKSCHEGNCKSLRDILNEMKLKNINPKKCFQRKSGDTALHISAREGHLNIIRFLYEEGICEDLEACNMDGKRCLHEAAQFSHPEIVDYILEKGAVVDPLKRSDWTPLMLACTKTGPNALDCIKKLLSKGSNPRLMNKDGWTPLHLAAREGDQDIVSLLLLSCPQLLTVPTNNKRTALHTAGFDTLEDNRS